MAWGGDDVHRLGGVLLVVLLGLLAGCGGHDSSISATPQTTQAPPSPAAKPVRAACQAQLRAGSRIADEGRLRGLSLARFQLRSNDMQEVVEEATQVCPARVVAPLKRSMLRLLATDQYLLSCAPDRSCDPAKVRRMIRRSVRLEQRSVALFG